MDEATELFDSSHSKESKVIASQVYGSSEEKPWEARILVYLHRGEQIDQAVSYLQEAAQEYGIGVELTGDPANIISGSQYWAEFSCVVGGDPKKLEEFLKAMPTPMLDYNDHTSIQEIMLDTVVYTDDYQNEEAVTAEIQEVVGKYGVTFEIVKLIGSGGGAPEVKYKGTYDQLMRMWIECFNPISWIKLEELPEGTIDEWIADIKKMPEDFIGELSLGGQGLGEVRLPKLPKVVTEDEDWV